MPEPQKKKASESLSVIDRGDDMQRRVRFQAAHAALIAVSFLREPCEWVALYCEHHEDICLERADGRMAGVQVKTRATTDCFKSTEKPIIEAVARFANLDEEFPNEFFRFVLAASPGFCEARNDVSNLCHIVHLAREDPDNPIVVHYAAMLAKSSPITQSQLLAVLAKTECQSLRGLDSIHAELLEELVKVPQLARLPVYQVTRIRGNLLNATQEAASLPPLANRYCLALNNSPRDAEIQAIIDKKRITPEKVKELIRNTFSETLPALPPLLADRLIPWEPPPSVEYASTHPFKVFVSSRMRDGALRTEREAIVKAVESTPFARAWVWERNGTFSDVSDEKICIDNASSSDSLVLILDGQVTPLALREFEAAYQSGVLCFILVKQGTVDDELLASFLSQQRARGIGVVHFRNASEIKTRICQTLMDLSLTGARHGVTLTQAMRLRSIL